MKTLRTTVGAIIIAALLLTLALLVYAMLRNRPQDLPWTKLDLSQPVGMFTGRKITGLTDDFPACRAALDKAGVRYTSLPARTEGEGCGFTDAVRSVTQAGDTFTFWDYQAGAWQKNNGIRIDHLMLSPEAANLLASATIEKHVRAWEKPSDHVPATVELALSAA